MTREQLITLIAFILFSLAISTATMIILAAKTREVSRNGSNFTVCVLKFPPAQRTQVEVNSCLSQNNLK